MQFRAPMTEQPPTERAEPDPNQSKHARMMTIYLFLLLLLR